MHLPSERPVVTVLKADMWKNYFCSAHKGFICTAEQEECKEDDGCITARCPPLYQSGGNLAPCIFLSQQTATWDEANDTCIRMEGRLAVIDSADKHERLIKDLSGDFSPRQSLSLFQIRAGKCSQASRLRPTHPDVRYASRDASSRIVIES